MLALVPLVLAPTLAMQPSLARPSAACRPSRAPLPRMDGGRPNKFLSKEDVLGATVADIFADASDYKEASRQYRRDVYAYSDWRAHRESGHVSSAFTSVFTSGVSKALWKECTFVLLLGLSVLLFNDALPAFGQLIAPVSRPASDFLGALPKIHLSLLPLTLSSPALFLLLVFRTNSSYDRWWEARKVWGSIINTSRDHARQACALVSEPEVREQMVAQVASYNRVLKFHLSPQSPEASAALRAELVANRLTDYQVEFVMGAAHKPMALMCLMSRTVHAPHAGLDTVQATKLDQSCTLLVDYLGMCERIIKTPIPLVYSRHTARFLSWWLAWLPICLYDQLPAHWQIIPAAALIAFFLVGIEELGNQIEEPFSILPLEAMGTGIIQSVFEMLDVSLGRPREAPSGGVSYVQMTSKPNEFVR
jgi:putative membrane protein